MINTPTPRPSSSLPAARTPVPNRWCLLLSLLIASELRGDEPGAELEFFEKRIRPVLTEHCYVCHSLTAREVQGKLRLDSREGMRRGGETGPAVVPGDPQKSLLLEAIRHESFEMPPDKQLPAAVIADFERWIRAGAVDPRDRPDSQSAEHDPFQAGKSHWSFQPVGRHQPPEVSTNDRVRNEVDRFLLQRLEAAGLAYARPASRETLIRRATYDLLGLPPTPEEIEQFLSDESPDAFAQLVDRLLDSPHYGERWGRHWLDVARYADNKGYVFFEEQRFPWAWTYRDYVVQAFNDDKPYDRFLIEQLAADRLDSADRRDALAAMGFVTLGGRFMNNTHDILDDRIDVVTRGILGLTVTCARCHDHKYDPVSQAEYYSLYGVFRSSIEPLVPPEFLPSPDTDAYREFARGLDERLRNLQTFIDAQREQLTRDAQEKAAEYLLAAHAKRNQPSTEEFMLLTDKGALHPGIIHRWEIALRRAKRSRDPVWTVWQAFAELSDEAFATGASEVHRRLFDPQATIPVNPLVRTAFADTVPESMAQIAEMYGDVLRKVRAQWLELIASSHETPPERLPDADAEAVRQALFGPNSAPMIPRELSWGFLELLPDRPTQEEFKKLLKEVEQWSMNQTAAPPRAMVLLDAETPYEPVVFLRGNPNREGDSVPRGFLSILSESPAFETRGSGRLELAQAIASPDNPLTARVLVNRVWGWHFGRGLVATPSDFGLRGDPPTHPELLDWLATDFVAHGWSIKHLHRRIMLSEAYRQQADRADADQAALVDPENRLLWRFPRRRLDFEATRDALLAVSGILDRQVGGPAVPIFSGLQPRRTLYGYIDRQDLPGLMRSFDFPDPSATAPRREQTTIAPQALFFMNDPLAATCAQRLLDRAEIRAASNDAVRIELLYPLLFGRQPDPEELAWATEFVAQPAEVVEQNSAASAWQYGYGAVDEQSRHVKLFTPLTHWTGTRWQAGPQLPDPQVGWAFHDRRGGHPAESHDRCAIRRWIAPADGAYEISGELIHHPEPGDGVRGRVVVRDQGILGEYVVDQSRATMQPISVTLAAGQTVDFVVDMRETILHDEHEWPVVIRRVDADAEPRDWNSERDFRGAAADRWTQLVHALLMTNEFVFID